MIINGMQVTNEEELAIALVGIDELSQAALTNLFRGVDNTIEPTAYEKDIIKYRKRAEVRDVIMAEIAAENMVRVRAGVWTVAQLISLTQDAGLTGVLNDMSSLSFELAQGKINALTHELITPEIKTMWIAKLQANLFNT